MVWAETEWVDPSERRRGIVSSVVLLAAVGIGGVLYASGLITITSGKSGIGLAVVGLAVLVAVALSANAIHPYRRTTAIAAGALVFHISPAEWNINERVVLETSRCRKKQPLAEQLWPRVARVVYFFPQRPTQRYARGQSLAGRRRQTCHLYELELQHPLESVYMRSSARATPIDVTVIVRAKHSLDGVWKKARSPHPKPTR